MIGDHKFSEVVSELEDIFVGEKNLQYLDIDFTYEKPQMFCKILKGSDTFMLNFYSWGGWYYLIVDEITWIPDPDFNRENNPNLAGVKAPLVIHMDRVFDDGFETLDDLMLYLAHHYA